jgi:hypothetical protein
MESKFKTKIAYIIMTKYYAFGVIFWCLRIFTQTYTHLTDQIISDFMWVCWGLESVSLLYLPYLLDHYCSYSILVIEYIWYVKVNELF